MLILYVMLSVTRFCFVLVPNRWLGASRGFAFVELYTVQDAQKWMEDTQV